MNIVTPTPTAILFPTANVPTESARRDNVQRETIPSSSANENSAAESGVGSESDRVKTPGQQPQVTYERPQNQQNAATQNNHTQGDALNQDNAEDPSAGKENAESEQQRQQQELAESREIEQLKSRDREVRAHEQAHAAVGGQYAGSPSYEFESGPDGKQYAVGGEVSIDISQEKTPEETVRKMQQVRAAALAPAEPSPQDLRVASEANRIATDARSDIAKEKTEEAKSAVSQNIDKQLGEPQIGAESAEQQNSGVSSAGIDAIGDIPDLDEIVDGFSPSSPTRSLDKVVSLDINDQVTPQTQASIPTESRASGILNRVSVIENFYQNVASPKSVGLQQSA